MRDVPTRVSLLLFLLFLLAALVPALTRAERSAAPITVIYPEPRNPERFVPIVLDGVRYVSTNDLARVFGATKYWRPEIQKLSLRIGEHTLRFSIGAPVVLVDEAAKNLIRPATLVRGVVYAPEEIVERIFDWGLASDAAWDETGRTIRFRGVVHSVRQAQLFVRGRVTEVSATLGRSLPARLLYAMPGEVRVLFEGGTLDTAHVFTGGAVARGEIREIPGGVDLRLVLGDSAVGYQVSSAPNRMKVAVTDDPGLVEAGLFTPLEPLRVGGKPNAVRTIVIDPGHGGTDLGAQLPGGMAEKDATLEIARSLRTALASRLNAKIVLTRESDVLLSPARRAELANEAGADLFISIHLEGDGTIKGGGFRLLAESPVASPNEGGGVPVVLPGDGDGIELKPWRSAQSAVVGASIAFAQTVADALARSFPQAPVLVRTGGMSVLEPVLCPAIVVESAPAARSGPESMSMRGYTTYDYTQTVARAIEDFVRKSRA
ncbi:MAG TPA: N-acetylmuramoyl-L-alanine amidase [Candidatus Binatia bacterium]|nr:N-acetylmuramoyl-L-alanine amidase [Candidatus Binatia bacterium]